MIRKTTARTRLNPGEPTAQFITVAMILLMLVLVVMPLGYLLYGALRSGPPRSDEAHFTLDNLAAIYGSIRFLQPFLTTLLIGVATGIGVALVGVALSRSEEHTSELQSLMRISYAVFCLKKKKKPIK